MRSETIKLLEEIIGKKLLDTDLGNDFSDMIPKAQAKKKVGLHQTKKFLHSQGSDQQNEKITHRV